MPQGILPELLGANQEDEGIYTSLATAHPVEGISWVGSGIWRPELELEYTQATWNVSKLSLQSPEGILVSEYGHVKG